MSIRQEIAIRKRKCHICNGVINKGEKYIRLSSDYKKIKTDDFNIINDNYNTGSNICSNCFGDKMTLYKYRCSTCGKIWYEEEVHGKVFHPNHGCPDGCDDAGEYLGFFKAVRTGAL